MVRTSRPLVERMTLVWHDWFATSNEGVGSQPLMIGQNELFRGQALGGFDRLLLDVTHDPAMLLWLNGTENVKEAPNENYGREMMELFTLGAERGAYSEEDVRQQARSLTGWQNRWSKTRGEDRLPLRPGRARRRRQARLRLERRVSAGRTPAGSASPTRCTPPSSSRSSGRTSSPPHRIPRRWPGSRRSTRPATR